ncbi:Disease resistance protein RPM1 [Dichanthelium oligosanthes]|uniref:Disease resistance protein RPM1 n=1 Tax=Dichanthelium oligosanthes TaxID=888268 RepID=A0A1E5W8Z3_9POAL|nr:Disease resistance protein RPM1 [Dichanthelium oligosanthes]
MASASITFVLNRLGELAVKEAALLRGVDDDIRLLRDKLEWLQTFIQHADQERRTGANKYIGLWVRQTRDVAYEVEDVLDEFLRKADLERLGLPEWKKWLKFATTCTTQVSVRHVLRDKMDSIKNRLKEISDNVDKYKIEQLQSSTSSAQNPTNSAAASWDEENEVFGFEEELKALNSQLLEGDKKRSVIAIVGESGIGKSTLAWKVYDSPDIRRHFDQRVSINIPPHIRDTDILYFIYNRLRPDAHDEKPSTIQEVHTALSSHLKGKRYLVMVDGLVNFTNWNSVLHGLPDNGNSSRIMIITRLEDKEAAYADPKVLPLKINYLDENGCKELFYHKIFGVKNKSHDKDFWSKSLRLLHKASLWQLWSLPGKEEENLKKIYEEIFEITQGLPLAIVVLSGFLRTKNFTEWDKVLSQLRTSEKSKRVKRILALCFDDLPSRLKSCFLYFAGMPENLIFNARHIVRLWVAEGFLKPKKGKTMEDIGQSYLKELISRGMINLVRKDPSGGVWLVTIHDRLHAFAQSEAHEESFLEVHDNADLLTPNSVRRLCLQNYMQSHVPMDTSFPKLRSILCDFSEERANNLVKNQGEHNGLRYHDLQFLPKSKFLRVIDLRGMRIRKVPNAIGNMVHIRYMGIRSSSLAELPSSIGRLINLQTLDIKRSRVKNVTQTFWEIPTLRHVVANRLNFPKSVGVLSNMQTLTGLVCSDPWEKSISPLHHMVYLRHLEISGLTSDHWEALADAFKKLESLVYLHLAAKSSDVKIPFNMLTEFTLQRLQVLELYGAINMSDTDIEERYTLPNLNRLVLKLSMVNQTFMNRIGELPSLKELVLSENSYDGSELRFSDSGFNSVTNLVMADLKDLHEWTIRPMSIPMIKRIALSGFSKLKIKLEGHDGAKCPKDLMANLEEVVVCNMHEDMIIEPADSGFSEKINKVAIKTKSEDIMDAALRAGRWRESMVAGNMYQY